MGTNYFHRTNICESCNRYKEVHIGKSSGGWEFSFQGYIDTEHLPRIKSFEDWKKELQTGNKIFDEYGREYSYEEFVKLVEDKKGGKFNGKPNLNHFDSCTEAGYNMERDWKDEQGHSFTSADFS